MSDNAPIAPVPDGKDWTWVLERPCSDCGFEPAAIDVADVPSLLLANAAAWPAVLARVDVRERPQPSIWSPLEYAAHVRDVFRLFRVRLDLMLAEDGPHFPNWDQDATAIAERYDRSDPAVVAEELLEAGEGLARRFAEVRGDDWRRTGFRSDGSAFTIESVARYLIHDPVHHLWDVRTRKPSG